MDSNQAEKMLVALWNIERESKRTNGLLERLAESFVNASETMGPIMEKIRAEYDREKAVADEKKRREELEHELWKIFHARENTPQDFNPAQYMHDEPNPTVEGYRRFLELPFVATRGTLLPYQWVHNLKLKPLPRKMSFADFAPLTEEAFHEFYERKMREAESETD